MQLPFLPTTAQLEVLSTPARAICFRHANKVGGTKTAIKWTIEHLQGKADWRYVDPGPINAIVLVPTWKHVRKNLNEYIFEFAPEVRAQCNESSSAMFGGWPGGEIKFPNKSQLMFRVSMGQQVNTAGFGASVVMIDEPCDEGKYSEAVRALGKDPHGGYLLINAAMVGRDVKWLRRMVEPDGAREPPPAGSQYQVASSPDWASFEVPLDPKTSPWMTPEGRRKHIARLPASQLRQRVLAKWDGQVSGARYHLFNPDINIGSWKADVGDVQRALATRWGFSTGWDHGIKPQHEACCLNSWHRREKRIWWLDTYVNPQRTIPLQDALGVRGMLDRWEIPTTAITLSRGDVGGQGKGSTDPRPTNQELSSLRDARGAPILGFPIALAYKKPGSVEDGVDEVNKGFASGTLMIDETNRAAIEAVLSHVDPNDQYSHIMDAERYIARELLIYQMLTRGKGQAKGW